MSGSSGLGAHGPCVLVRIEGVDFDRSMSDVNDLSTQRGAGLAYLAAPRALITEAARLLDARYEEVFTGASAGTYWLHTCEAPCRIEAGVRALAGARAWPANGSAGSGGDMHEIRESTGESYDPFHVPRSGMGAERSLEELDVDGDALERKAAGDDTDFFARLRPVLPHLNFAVAAEKLCRTATVDHATARLRLLSRARESQLRSPTVASPAATQGKWRPCRLNPSLPATGPDRLSDSVRERRKFGRIQKQYFYKNPAYGVCFNLPDGHVFARDLNDLVRDPPPWVKPAVRNKIAHLYLDGNDFTRIREQAISDSCDPLQTEQDFSKKVNELRGAMLRTLLDNLVKLCDMTADKRIFRWETLLWGGDEAAFVMPGWVALHALSILARNISGSCWNIGGQRVTHKIGIYIADRKTPVAVARKIAEALADSAKMGKSGANVAQIMVTESADPPMDVANIGPDLLAQYRNRYFGCGDPAAFTFDLDMPGDCTIEGLSRVKDNEGGLPRSQLYGLLRERPESDELWNSKCDAAFERSGAKCREVFLDPPFGPAPCGCPLLPFMRVAELLDYHSPELSR